MKAPLSWIKDYVDIDVSAEELQTKLFGCGFEVEELYEIGKIFLASSSARLPSASPSRARTFPSALWTAVRTACCRFAAGRTTSQRALKFRAR